MAQNSVQDKREPYGSRLPRSCAGNPPGQQAEQASRMESCAEARPNGALRKDKLQQNSSLLKSHVGPAECQHLHAFPP